ncbi:MAG: NB-ARC domain-containing protein [Myxococcota bacterium]
MKVVGDVLRRRREERHLSRGELADLIGLTAKTIQRAEAGGPIRSQVVRELCRALALPLGGVVSPSDGEVVARLRAFGRGPSPAPKHWVPRVDEVSLLLPVLTAEPEHHVRFCTLAGPPAIGKTALAQHVVALVADEFPAGVVWLDGSHIATLAELRAAQRDIGEALGFETRADASAQRDVDQSFSHHFWSRRRLLIVDDARSTELIDALRGENEVGMVLVTTRSRRIAEHASGTAVPLDPIEASCARTILEEYVGAARLDSDATGTEALVALVAHAPGSIHPTGRLLHREPFRRPSDLIGHMTDTSIVARDETQGWWKALVLEGYQREQLRVSDGAWQTLARLAAHGTCALGIEQVAELCEVARPVASGYLSELLDAYLLHLSDAGGAEPRVHLDPHGALVGRVAAGR